MLQLMTDGILRFLANQPKAFAHVKGSEHYPDVQGLVTFYDLMDGTIVMVDISGLPDTGEPCGGKFYGFHIHEGAACTGNDTVPILPMQVICLCWKETGAGPGRHFIRNALHPNR